jgi:hypothetical protein
MMKKISAYITGKYPYHIISTFFSFIPVVEKTGPWGAIVFVFC